MYELCRLRRSEGYGVREDDGQQRGCLVCGNAAAQLPHDFRAEARTHFHHGGIHLKKKVNRTKSVSLTFRVTERDAETIRRNAKSVGMDLTKYLTTCAVGKEIVHINGLDDCSRALRRQGTNLNQLTTLANMGRISSVNVGETYELYLEIQKLLKEVLERQV